MPQLGALETRVMGVLWAASAPLSVREVHDALDASELAYTTIMTVLDRLAKKQIVLRERDGKAWLYTVPGSREEMVAGDIVDALRQAGVDVSSLAQALSARLTPAEKAVLGTAFEGS
ncbi:MAG TPA: BlaI/MecI/CopY family transcriptional regulator [Propionibacteriaceae bacterium]|nr:BlaI/MecI/CopY family transcriptional regulator [Propionibacteriaceae bacterium]